MDKKNRLNSVSTPCGSLSFLKACREIARNLPICSGIDPYFRMIRPNRRNYSGGATLVDLFELSDILVKKDLITLRNTSWCMFPVLMKGDVLKVKPSKVDQMNIGDIAVFRRFRWLYGHRVIDKKRIDGKDFVFTRPDGSKRGNNGPTGDDDLLGKVTAVLRKGKAYSPERRTFSIKERFYHLFILLRLRIEDRIKSQTKFLLKVLQRYSPFRVFLFKVFSPIRSQLRFSIGIPTNFKATARFFNYIRLEDINPHFIKRIKDSQRWHMVVTCQGGLVGNAAIIHRPDNCPYKGYWVEDLFVMERFRGAKIGTQIWKRLEHILGKIGIDRIYVSVSKNDIVAKEFFKSIGFSKRQAYEKRLNVFEKAL